VSEEHRNRNLWARNESMGKKCFEARERYYSVAVVVRKKNTSFFAAQTAVGSRRVAVAAAGAPAPSPGTARGRGPPRASMDL
jgi:hypothetical protein